MKLDKSLSNAIPKGPLRNTTCPLTDQTSKMKKNKTKLIIMKHRKKKKVFRICIQEEKASVA